MMQLARKQYPYMKEILWQGKLDNGLTVFLLPKKDFYETYGMLTVEFGAIHTKYRLVEENKEVILPAGIAHFLEHKLFESEDGLDVMEKFAHFGANANAYTSLQQTSYLFSTSKNYLDALELLQTFIFNPFFTVENVEKEQGIIGQEIDMYQDDVDYRLYTGILSSLFPKTALACDIAGTKESIKCITAENLYENHSVFYQTNNMTLVVIGQFDVEEVWENIQLLQKNNGLEDKKIESIPLEKLPILEHRTEEMEVSIPKLAVGLRGNDLIHEKEMQRYRLGLHLLFAMLMGWTSKRYQMLYEKGKIDSSFSFHIEVSREYHFIVITVDTNEPIQLSSVLRKAIHQFESDLDVNEEHLQLIKREMYGDFIRGLNSLEFTASYFMTHYLEGQSIFDIPDMIETIGLSEILAIGRQFISNCDMTDFTIFPK